MARILKRSNMIKTINYLKKNGLKQAYYAVLERTAVEIKDDYHYEMPSDEVLNGQREKSAAFSIRFSILVPAYETQEKYLRPMLESVLAQTYGNFELILADASESDCVKNVVAEYSDKRIIYRRLENNIGISGNSNKALMYASGDYACLLDHDDLLTPDALYECAVCIAAYEEKGIELQMLYSDEDKCNGAGTRFFAVHKKPGFNLDLILSNNYICHFLVMKRQLMQELGFRSICDGAQDHDLVLRAVDRMLGRNKKPKTKEELPIAHISKVLYHWRCHEDSTAENPASKEYAYDAGKRTVEDFIREHEYKATVAHTRHLGFYRVNYEPDVLSNRPDVAVVGGKLINKHQRVVGGIFDENEKPMYVGLHKEYSGYMHRASCQQEAYAIDIRCMKCSQEAEEVLAKMIGLPYLKHSSTGRFFYQDCLKDNVDYVELSLKFCQKLREMNKRIVWDPEMIQKVDE